VNKCVSVCEYADIKVFVAEEVGGWDGMGSRWFENDLWRDGRPDRLRKKGEELC